MYEKVSLQNNELVKRLKRKIYYLIGSLIVVVVVFGVLVLFSWNSLEQIVRAFKIERSAPYSQQIKKILKHLKYNGFHRILDEEVYVDINFKEATWTLRNIHHYEKNGDLRLKNNQYGVCGDLITYVYQKIQPFFQDQYRLEVLNVEESYFFNKVGSSHMILRIIGPRDLVNPNVYIIDPSFGRYGFAESFEEEYYLNEVVNVNSIGTFKGEVDEVYRVDHHVPILIANNYLLQIGVRKVDNTFDKNHFEFVLSGIKRYGRTQRDLFVMRNEFGLLQKEENEKAVLKIFGAKKAAYRRLRDLIERFFTEEMRLHKKAIAAMQ